MAKSKLQARMDAAVARSRAAQAKIKRLTEKRTKIEESKGLGPQQRPSALAIMAEIQSAIQSATMRYPREKARRLAKAAGDAVVETIETGKPLPPEVAEILPLPTLEEVRKKAWEEYQARQQKQQAGRKPPTALAPAGPPTITPPPSFTPGAPQIEPPPSFMPHGPATPFQGPTGPEDNLPAPGQGIVILDGTEISVPHTLLSAKGRHVHTDRWFDRQFLCYDASKPRAARGGMYDPWMGLEGRGFRCYYPESTRTDWIACRTSGSSGRWLNSWSELHNYVSF